MDENEFLKTHKTVNDRPCAFSKALLRRCCGCSRSQRLLIAEREVMACRSPAAHERCSALVDTLRQKALFSLQLTHIEGKLPHGKEIKVQCGGLLGLSKTLSAALAAEFPASDVHTLLDHAVSHYGAVEALPYGELVKAIVHFKSRSSTN